MRRFRQTLRSLRARPGWMRWRRVDAKSVDDDYTARMKARAVDCGHGYQPSVIESETSIHEQLIADKDCFARVDQKLQEWVAYRQIGLLLTELPLRPLPDVAPSIILAGANIAQADFAESAGVVLVQEAGKYEVIDIGKGDVIAHGPIDYSAARSLSPNGRLFVVAKDNDVQIRETETGTVIATIPRIEADGFHWVGAIGAVYKPGWTPDQEDSGQEAPMFVDFTSGNEIPIAMAISAVNHVVALPGAIRRIAVLAAGKIGEIKLTHAQAGWDATFLSERRMPTLARWGNGASGFTADGEVFFDTGQSLELFTLATMNVQVLTLDPMRLQAVVATADPDRLLLSGFFPSAPLQGTEYTLYSLSQRTLAKVDQTQLLSKRVIYIPSLHKNAVIEDSKIVVIGSIPAAAPVPINDYLELRERAVDTLENSAGAHAMQLIANPPTPPSAASPALPGKVQDKEHR
jgi:hypothetical protein